MKIRFVKSLSGYIWDGDVAVAKEENRGLAARVIGSDKQRTLSIILPCGHHSTIEGWDITDIDTDTPSATPSIYCMGFDNKGCWHGYLTKGELVQ